MFDSAHFGDFIVKTLAWVRDAASQFELFLLYIILRGPESFQSFNIFQSFNF